ncbi:MAG: dodecin family protein [Balneolaceae bacterium]|nr:dodecin family protein [Balneolaceae bacterium]
MSVAKIIEIKAEGDTIEQAFDNAVAEASKTVNNIESVWADDIEAVVENNEIKTYRVNTKITFVVNK